jgi:hypothetical protein
MDPVTTQTTEAAVAAAAMTLFSLATNLICSALRCY